MHGRNRHRQFRGQVAEPPFIGAKMLLFGDAPGKRSLRHWTRAFELRDVPRLDLIGSGGQQLRFSIIGSHQLIVAFSIGVVLS